MAFEYEGGGLKMALETFNFRDFLELSLEDIKKLKHVKIIGFSEYEPDFYNKNNNLSDDEKNKLVEKFCELIAQCENLEKLEFIQFLEKVKFNGRDYTFFTENRMLTIFDALKKMSGLKNFHLNLTDSKVCNENFLMALGSVRSFKELTLKSEKASDFFSVSQIDLFSKTLNYCKCVNLIFDKWDLDKTQSTSVCKGLKNCEEISFEVRLYSSSFDEPTKFDELMDVLSDGTLKKCRKLSFRHNHLEKLPAESLVLFFESLQKFPQLESLDLSFNNLEEMFLALPESIGSREEVISFRKTYFETVKKNVKKL